MTKKQMRLRQRPEEPGAAYLELHDHPHVPTRGLSQRTVDVHELIEDFSGPRISIDFNSQGLPVGIEILYPIDEEEEERKEAGM